MTAATTHRITSVLVALALLAACSRREPDDVSPDAAPRPAQRIVSQAIVADEILWDLGDEVRGRVVAVSKFADEPRYGARAPWPKHVSRLGPHGEQLIALEPDLVIAASFTSPELRALLDRSGVPTIVLDDFTGFDDYRSAAQKIGQATGAQAPAASLIEAFDEALRGQSAPPTAEAPSIVSWIGAMVAGSQTTFDDAANAAGLTNIAATGGIRGHKRVPLELVVSWDPDFVVTACGTAGCDAAVARLLELPAVSATRAAAANRVLAIDERILLATGSGMVELVATLRRLTVGAR